MAKHIGILTAGGDSPGLNAAIRGVGKTAQSYYGMQVIGFRDGFRGLVGNRTERLDGECRGFILFLEQMIQVGVVSFGSKKCGNGVPAVYTRVTAYTRWIADNLKP